MRQLIRPRTDKVLALSAFLLALLVLCGCGGGKSDEHLNLIPVSGKVTLVSGSPVPTGCDVQFHPDKEKGNRADRFPSGRTNAEGVYSLKTPDSTGKAHDGAPAGWYKVTLQAGPPSAGETQKTEDIGSLCKSFNKQNNSVEVKADAKAGSYDFKVK